MSTAASLTADRDIWRPKFNPWLIAVVVAMAAFMEVLDTSIANVALPYMAGNLGASNDQSTWVLTSYLVSNAIVLPISGWLALALESVVQARKLRYLMANVARDRLDEVRDILPGIGGPDVVELLDGGALIAVQAVVALPRISATIRALKAIGATGIVVTRIERFIP